MGSIKKAFDLTGKTALVTGGRADLDYRSQKSSASKGP